MKGTILWILCLCVLLDGSPVKAWGLADYAIELSNIHSIRVGCGRTALVVKTQAGSEQVIFSGVARYGQTGHWICGQLNDGTFFLFDTDSGEDRLFPDEGIYRKAVSQLGFEPPVLKIPAYEDSIDAKQNPESDIGEKFMRGLWIVFWILLGLLVISLTSIWIKHRNKKSLVECVNPPACDGAAAERSPKADSRTDDRE